LTTALDGGSNPTDSELHLPAKRLSLLYFRFRPTATAGLSYLHYRLNWGHSSLAMKARQF